MFLYKSLIILMQVKINYDDDDLSNQLFPVFLNGNGNCKQMSLCIFITTPTMEGLRDGMGQSV
jgi:hypothetical protein